MIFDARKTRVAVAMSGGVDSSVACAIALQEDFEAVGVTLRLRHPDPEFSRIQQCAGQSDAQAIDEAVSRLGIAHRYIDAFADFERMVLRPAAHEYLAGLTPNPCCMCNPLIKFGKLLEFTGEIGAKYLMTGHYARTGEVNGRIRLFRGVDAAKDQSYFLYRLTPEQLAKIVFPLGEFTKPDVRELAASLGLPAAERPDSQDACFAAENECFGETLRRLCGLPSRPGVFTFRGKVVGRHNGIHQYTIGQRKGLNVALGTPAYVTKLHPDTGAVELDTDRTQLECAEFRIRNCVWHEDFTGSRRTGVRIRYRSSAVPAALTRRSDGSGSVRLDAPLRAVTPGQSAVFYDGDMILGGGVIDAD